MDVREFLVNKGADFHWRNSDISAQDLPAAPLFACISNFQDEELEHLENKLECAKILLRTLLVTLATMTKNLYELLFSSGSDPL